MVEHVHVTASIGTGWPEIDEGSMRNGWLRVVCCPLISLELSCSISLTGTCKPYLLSSTQTALLRTTCLTHTLWHNFILSYGLNSSLLVSDPGRLLRHNQKTLQHFYHHAIIDT